MGGSGSGEWTRSKPRKENTGQCFTLSARALHGAPLDVWHTGQVNDGDGKEICTLGIFPFIREVGGSLAFRFKYTVTVTRNGEQTERPLEYEVDTERAYLPRIEGRRQGTRLYFLCPQCGRRAGKLYKTRQRAGDYLDYFICRGCAGLTYLSSQRAHYKERLDNELTAMMRRHYGRGWRLQPDTVGK